MKDFLIFIVALLVFAFFQTITTGKNGVFAIDSYLAHIGFYVLFCAIYMGIYLFKKRYKEREGTNNNV